MVDFSWLIILVGGAGFEYDDGCLVAFDCRLF